MARGCDDCSPGQDAEWMHSGLRAAPDMVDEVITDLSYKRPRILFNNIKMEMDPLGIGEDYTKLEFKMNYGGLYSGFSGWQEQRTSTSNNHPLGRHNACAPPRMNDDMDWGFQERRFRYMERAIKSPSLCIEDIRTKFQFEQQLELIVEGMAERVIREGEQLTRNAFNLSSIKHLGTPNLDVNTFDPRIYRKLAPPAAGRNVSATPISTSNYRLLSIFASRIEYQYAKAAPAFDGMTPLFLIKGSKETLRNMIYNDPELRNDFRWSNFNDSLLNSYGISDKLMEFIFLYDSEAPRYEVDSVGNLVQVPYEVDRKPYGDGVATDKNDRYDRAPYEGIQIIPVDPLVFRFRPEIRSLPGGATFAENNGMDFFKWKYQTDPATICNPWPLTGLFVAKTTLAVEIGNTPIFELLVRRDSKAFMTSPLAINCVTEVDCPVVLPEVTCPCPIVTDIVADPINPLVLYFGFNIAPGLIIGNPAEILLKNGGSITGTVAAINTTTNYLGITFATPQACVRDAYVSLVCGPVGFCETDVIATDTCMTSINNIIKVTLARPIRCNDSGDTVTATFGDGYKVVMALNGAVNGRNEAMLQVSVAPATTYQVFCDHGCITHLCCVAGQDGCLGCEALVQELCEAGPGPQL